LAPWITRDPVTWPPDPVVDHESKAAPTSRRTATATSAAPRANRQFLERPYPESVQGCLYDLEGQRPLPKRPTNPVKQTPTRDEPSSPSLSTTLPLPFPCLPYLTGHTNLPIYTGTVIFSSTTLPPEPRQGTSHYTPTTPAPEPTYKPQIPLYESLLRL
jgi:hypothetical protein